MNASISYQDKQHDLQEFLDKLKTIDNLVKYGNLSLLIWLMLLPGLLLATWGNSKKSRRLILNIRSVINTCKTDCKNSKCLNIFYDDAKEIRDTYLFILEEVSKIHLLSFFFSDMIEKSLADWDDLVEDCLVGSDSEFKDLIMQIADSA